MPRSSHALWCCAVLLAWAAVAPLVQAAKPAASATPESKVDFVRDIQPIFKEHCYKCHGPDDQEGGVRLNSRKSAFAGGDSGHTIISPGEPDKSRLVELISGKDEKLRMPPEDEGAPLGEPQVALLTRWIKEGAAWPENDGTPTKLDHWAWKKPVRPPLPPVVEKKWPRVGLDHFVLATLEREGIKPAPEADRWILARRLSLDLRGLPPTLQEAEAFVNDTRPDAYERLVDQLMDDPAFGERWAQVWLDLARYADSRGYGGDPFRTIWRYRDWVINALNHNEPFDRFTIEQIAGDLLPDAREEQLLATAFHRNSMSNNESGVDNEEFRTVAVQDRVETTLQVWMGLTVGCAKCHSHKFDPITQREYYELYAFFDQTEDANRMDEEPTLAVGTKAQQDELAQLKAEIALVKKGPISPEGAERRKKLNARYDAIEKSIVKTPICRELPASHRRISRIMRKGSFLDQGDPVEATVPAAFHPLPKDAPRNRLGLARWLVDPANPLTARVTVNRFWARLWGQGLVATEEDFGTQGAKPSNGKLLDWLAVEFMEKDWDIKGFLRTVVTSATYRQSSALRPGLTSRDPLNRLLARAPRFRLPAETIRDQALAQSGLLCRKLGGPSVYPPQPDGIWKFTDDTKWPGTSQGDDRYRRGLYTFARRLAPYPSMATFDAPSREVCTLRRTPTNTPLQAFVTLNDPVYVEAAQALARRVVREGGTPPRERLTYALRLCLCRPPRPEQIDALLDLIKTETEFYQAHPAKAEQLATDPLGPLPKELNVTEIAAWTVVANVLLNLDGVLTRS